MAFEGLFDHAWLRRQSNQANGAERIDHHREELLDAPPHSRIGCLSNPD